VLLLSCCVAAVNVFIAAETPLLQFFLYGLLWSLQLLVISLYLPYDSLKRNVQNVLVGFATLTHSAIFLGVQRGGASSGYMIALLLLFALILTVLLFREKLAVNVPWLRVLRRADMKKQEAEIVKAAVELERQLTRALSSPMRPPLSRETSSTHDAPRHLLIVSPDQQYEVAEGQPGEEASSAQLQDVGSERSAPAPLPPREEEDGDIQRELAAQADHKHVHDSNNPQGGNDENGASVSALSTPRSAHSPASPSLLHRGVGPGQLFVPRTSLLTVSDSDATSARPSPRAAISGSAVQLAPLRPPRTESSSAQFEEIPRSGSVGPLPPIQQARVLSVPRMLEPLPSRVLTPLPMLASPPSLVRAAPVVDLDHVLDEHERNQLNATHAYERERQQQLQRARKLKEERRQLKKEAAAAAPTAALEANPAGSRA
jgi:hypothetical protein